MKLRKLFFVVIMFVSGSGLLMAQNGRDYIKRTIQQWGQCRNVALTQQNGNVALAGRNAAAWQNVPNNLAQRLQSMANDGMYIDDVQLTEGGRWLIVGDTIYWDRIGSDLENEIKRLVQRKERIISITFNDYGEWIVISENSYSSSNTDIQRWLRTNANRYGFLRAACVTDDCMVAVYENGFAYQGNMPKACWDALDTTNLDIHRLKISGDSWFFADADGNYQGYM